MNNLTTLIRTRKSCRRKLRRGAAAVEFAITAPIFLLFLLSAFEFGWLNVMRHTADNAAYEAARAAMVPGATTADATGRANQLLSAVGARNAKISITPSTITTSTTDVNVTIDLPMSSNSLIVGRFTGNTVLHSSSTLKTERSD
jgi:Flp pilus assembly protein TadG